MRCGFGAALSSLLLSGVLRLPSWTAGQVEVFGLKASGEAEVGGRIFVDRPSKADRAKFEEYRDIPSVVFLEHFRLQLESQDGMYSLELGGRDAGEEDQHFFLRGTKLGQYTFEFEWDQLPHVYSGTARSPHVETSEGVLALPDPLQTGLQGASAAARPGILQSFLATAPNIDLQTRWDTARVLMSYTPTPDWDLRAEYTRTLKQGGRPIGMVFGSPGGNLIELPEPIDQTINDFRMAAGLAMEQWQREHATASMTLTTAPLRSFSRPRSSPIQP